MENKKHRLLLVSDVHYTIQSVDEKLKKEIPNIKPSLAAGMNFGYTQDEKAEKMLCDICEENEKGQLDAVLFLGDLSIDDYNSRNLPINYCEKLKKEYLDKLPCKYYAIPGNHDSYPDAEWKRIFGYGRRFSVKTADALFVMDDTFADVPAEGASGSKYTSIDAEFVEKEIEKNPSSKVFLCTHYIKENENNEKLTKLLSENDKIGCIFRAHTHYKEVISGGKTLGGKTIVDIGGYGYNGFPLNGSYSFNIFHEAWAWGYEILEWDDCGFEIYHVTPSAHYEADNGTFDIERKITGRVKFNL